MKYDDETEKEIRDMERSLEREHRNKIAPKSKESMKLLHDTALKSEVGTKIKCPSCGREHTKTSTKKIFCSNYSTAGNRNCKDRYWNIVDPAKANRLNWRQT